MLAGSPSCPLLLFPQHQISRAFHAHACEPPTASPAIPVSGGMPASPATMTRWGMWSPAHAAGAELTCDVRAPAVHGAARRERAGVALSRGDADDGLVEEHRAREVPGRRAHRVLHDGDAGLPGRLEPQHCTFVAFATHAHEWAPPAVASDTTRLTTVEPVTTMPPTVCPPGRHVAAQHATLAPPGPDRARVGRAQREARHDRERGRRARGQRGREGPRPIWPWSFTPSKRATRSPRARTRSRCLRAPRSAPWERG